MKPIISFSNPQDVREHLAEHGCLNGIDDDSVVLNFMTELHQAKRRKDFAVETFVNSFCDLQHRKNLQKAHTPRECLGSLVPMIAPESTTAVQTYVSTALAPSTPMIVPYADRMPQIATMIPSRRGGQKSRSPFEIAQTLLCNVQFAVVGEALYAFNGRNYEFLTSGMAKRLIMGFCWQDVGEKGSAEIVSQVFELVQMNPHIVFNGLHPDVRYMTFLNGLFCLEDFSFQPHSPRIFDTACLRLDFVPGCSSACPYFDRFLNDIAAGQQDLINRLWEIIGYLLTNDTAAKAFFLFQGVPDSGKSLLGRFIVSLFSESATTSVDIGSLGQQFALSELVGKKLNASLDLPAGQLNREAISCIKQLTGGDLMTANVKYFPRIRFYSTCRLLYASNHRILTAINDPAFFSRLVVVPFARSIPKAQQDTELLQKFEDEKVSIVNNALRAYIRLKTNNYAFSGNFRVNEVCAGAMSDDAETVDIETFLGRFLSEQCHFDPNARTLTGDLHRAFCDFAKGDVLTMDGFSKALKAICGEQIQKGRWRKDGETSSNPQNGFRGIALGRCENDL